MQSLVRRTYTALKEQAENDDDQEEEFGWDIRYGSQFCDIGCGIVILYLNSVYMQVM